MDPINYIQNVKNPFESAIQGYQIGQAFKQQQAAAAQAEAQRAAQLQMQQELGALAANQNATSADYAGAMTKYPQMAENLKRSWDVLDEGQKQVKLSDATKIYSALQTDNSDVAKTLLNDQAIALRNSGKEAEAKNAENMAKLIELNPQLAKTTAGLSLSAIMGPDKFASTFESLSKTQNEADQAPTKLAQLKSNAETDRIKALYAQPEAVAELEKKGWDIKKLQSDIVSQRESNRIAAMNAATSREGNSLKRQEMQMKLMEEKGKIQDKLNEKVANVESSRATMDNFINTADKILQAPNDVVRAATGTLDAILPTMQTDVADFERLVETLGSQAFLGQVQAMKGMGALSNAEGEKLQSALANFSLRQSDKSLMDNVREAQRIIAKGRKNLADKYGVPDTVPDTPAVKPTGNEIDALLKKYGG